MSLFTRKADFKPQTFADNMVEIVWATDTPLQRFDSRGAYHEILSMNPAHVDLSRFIGGPLLNGHRQGDVRDVIGVIESATVKDGIGIAKVRFSERADVADIIKDVRSGVLRQVSVGYSVEKWADGTTGGTRTRTAIKWQPAEASLVPLAFDPNATVRNLPMTTPNTETTPPDNAAVMQTRAAIREIARRSALPFEWADSQIDSGNDLVQVRAAAHEAMLSRATPFRVSQVGVSGDDPEQIIKRRAEALHSRYSGAKPSEPAREYVNDSVLDTAKALLAMRGINSRGSSAVEILTRSFGTTSDWPRLLEDFGQRSLLPAYSTAVSPLKKIFAKRNARDFRPHNLLRIGEHGSMQKLNEAGEIRSVTRIDIGESYQIDTYASMFSLTRQAIINDSLGAFSDFAAQSGKSAAYLENDLMVKLLESNPVLDQDGQPVFHASHNNLAPSTTGLNADALSDARQSLRNTKSVDGKTLLNIAPRYLIVSSELETQAQQLLMSIQPTRVADVNPFAGSLELLVEPRLASAPFYVAGDNVCLIYSYLEGAEGPQIGFEDSFDILGSRWRVFEDFGVAAIDWRGLWKSPG